MQSSLSPAPWELPGKQLTQLLHCKVWPQYCAKIVTCSAFPYTKPQFHKHRLYLQKFHWISPSKPIAFSLFFFFNNAKIQTPNPTFMYLNRHRQLLLVWCFLQLLLTSLGQHFSKKTLQQNPVDINIFQCL